MGIITDITVPSTAFELGSSLAQVEKAHITFERTVPTGDRLFPYMWVHTADHTRFCQLLQVNQAVESVRLVHHQDTQGLYDVVWQDETDGFLSCLKNTEAVVLKAGGSTTAWEFELRFDCHEDVAAFQRECSEQDISITVDRIVTKSVVEPPGEKLTGPQRETIELALERGYFDVPRKTTMVELAEELGISDQAVSARIRRAMKKLSEHLLLPEVEQTDTKPELTR